MPSLADQFRPKHVAAIAGQSDAKEQVERVIARSGVGARAFWFAGPSGTGKTTFAYIIASYAADDFGITELDASELTPARLKAIEEEMQGRILPGKTGKTGRAYIVNESHGLRKDGVRQLLVLLERLPEYVTFVFTTSEVGGLFGSLDKDVAALISRCIYVRLDASEETQASMAQRAKRIAESQGIDGFADAVYIDALRLMRGNMRMLLSSIESGSFVQSAEELRALRTELNNPKLGAKRRKEIEEALDL